MKREEERGSREIPGRRSNRLFDGWRGAAGGGWETGASGEDGEEGEDG